MVFFALTRTGYEEFVRLLGVNQNFALWVNKDVLNDVELAHVRAASLSVTNFMRNIDIADRASVDDALDTIREHHSHESIWVEC